jgi:hypothetical protein
MQKLVRLQIENSNIYDEKLFKDFFEFEHEIIKKKQSAKNTVI